MVTLPLGAERIRILTIHFYKLELSKRIYLTHLPDESMGGKPITVYELLMIK